MGFAEETLKEQDRDAMLLRAMQRIIQLYTDKSHFVYELLQNAEDAGATQIKFLQFSDRLEVFHNGQPFSKENLKGICDVGLSSKTGDLNQIGEFGVGFKSVYCICDSVQLYSCPSKAQQEMGFEPFSCEIQNFTNAITIAPREVPGEYTTLFVFPYSVGQTYSGFHSFSALNKKLSERLKNLGSTTLLFMKRLKSISYEIQFPNSKSHGIYRQKVEQKSENCRLVESVGETKAKKSEDSSFLVFSKEIDKQSHRTVDIAFSICKNNAGEINFEPTNSPYVSVYFPTGTESKLNFIVQGPYRTTPNRSEIPQDDEQNVDLARATGKLLYDSVLQIRKMGFLSVDLLSLLPLELPQYDTEHWLFTPLFEKTKELFSKEKILPCLSGGYTDTAHAMIGRRNQEMSTVFPEKIMSSLIASKGDSGKTNQFKWLLTALTENTYGSLYSYLTKTHKIKEIRLEDFARMFAANPFFLPEMTDDWVISFYQFLDKYDTPIRYDDKGLNLFDIPIVKVTDGSFIAPYNRKTNLPNVYLPTTGTIPGLQFVAEPFATKCVQFLSERLRLGSPSLSDEIYNVRIPHYLNSEAVDVWEDFDLFYSYYKSCPVEEKERLLEAIRQCHFVLCWSKEEQGMRHLPTKLYFPSEELKEYFDVSGAWFVDIDYYLNKYKKEHRMVRSFLSELGVADRPRLIDIEPDFVEKYHPLVSQNSELRAYCENHNICCPSKWTGNKIKWVEREIEGCKENIDYIVKTVQKAKRQKDSAKCEKLLDMSGALSAVLWQQLLSVAEYYCEEGSSLEESLQGYCEYTDRRTYKIPNQSTIIDILRSKKWLLTKGGSFETPGSVFEDDLDEIYLRRGKPYKALLELLKIKQKADDNLSKEQREDLEFARLCRQKGITLNNIDSVSNVLALLERKESSQSRQDNWDGDHDGSSNERVQYNPELESTRREQQSIPKIYEEISKRSVSERGKKQKVQSEEHIDADEDDFTKRSVDYQKKIDAAMDKSKAEIEEIAALKELQEQTEISERYSFAWFKALLQLEARNSAEGNSQSREISISFGKVERDSATTRTLLLKQPSRYIPQWIEELTDIPLKLCVGGQTRSVAVEVVNVQSYTLRAKLKNGAEIDGINLSEVTEAKIEAQSPAFLLEELSKQFGALELEDTDNLRDKLCENIEFIFGPPGTGKTTYLAQKVLLPLMQQEENARVLVLTPTNKAADVLAKRIMDSFSPNDTSYTDWLIRFGTAADESVEQSGIFKEKTSDIRQFKRNVTITTIARFPYDFFMPSGERLYLRSLNWDYIIVDEASMIPLINIIYPLYAKTPKKFIVAGDPFQIEPISSVDLWKDENIYTMVQLQSFTEPKTVPYDYPVTLLTTQYRSIPTVGEVFSKFSYGGILDHYRFLQDQLKTGAEETLGISALNIIRFPISKYESIYRAKKLNNSPYQTYSALFTYEYIKYYAETVGQNCREHFTIGVIAPYRAQADLVDRLMASAQLPENVSVQVGTIHGFQGDECNAVFALLNPPPYISAPPEMFLNKRNIINVAVSRARDYLFIVMPDSNTENLQNLRLVRQIESLCLESGDCSEFQTSFLENQMFGNEHYLEENSFCTGHQAVNVYGLPELHYEIRSEDSAIDVQIHNEIRG